MSKIWFVTGANSGIGAGIVKAALAAGERVIATVRNLEKLRAAFPNNENKSLALIALDVTNHGQATAAIAKAVEHFGTIDVLVNNAGFCILGNFEDLSVNDFERQFATNFFGTVNVMKAVLPIMRKQHSGHIINISSVAGGVGNSQCSAYAASKFALEGMSAAVAEEVERFGIHITVVEPGYFRTSFVNTKNAEVVATQIDDYVGKGISREALATIDGKQLGNPDKLGQVIVKISAMEKPLKLFVAGSDAVQMLEPVARARLQSVLSNVALSSSTDGNISN